VSAIGRHKPEARRKRLIVTADDFGLSESVNEGVERAHRNGVLTSASLMVAGPAAADAVRRAKAMPALRVGLHLVAIEGPAVLPPSRIPNLVDAKRWFPSDQFRLGVEYAVNSAARRQLADEIRAQFEAYAATGLALDHADAHKHMHLHPYVAKLLLEIGPEFGLRAVRIPAEPPTTIAHCGTPATAGRRALYAWSGLLRRRARRAGMTVAGAVFGVAWSGHMTTPRLKSLISNLPDGISEIYCHPAVRRDAAIEALMPDYEHEAELAALIDPDLRTMLERFGIVAGGYGDLA
jgi:hopanoid biosynthesis associated protein HpnK